MFVLLGSNTVQIMSSSKGNWGLCSHRQRYQVGVIAVTYIEDFSVTY